MEETNHRSWVIGIIVGIIIGGIIGGIFGTYLVFQNPKLFPWAQKVATVQEPTKPANNNSTVPVSTVQPSIENAVENVVQEVSPAVVRIVSTKEVLDYFFLQVVPQQGLGSGVIIRPDGLILTNNHVIEDASKIEVTLSDGKTYKGKVVGADPISDVALVKINATNLPYVELGDSSKLKVGQFVVAIGNPYGLDHTVTVGVVSALERNINVGNKTMHGVIQTDAAINPGNSGGPLVSLDGKVVGINTMIYQNAQGLGFAVSSNTCKKVINSILKNGKVEWPFLGVEVTTMTQEIADQLHMKYVPGVLVAKVMKGSAAEKAGIKQGDIITSIEGTPVKTSDQLIDIIRSHNVGDHIIVEVVRKGLKETLRLEVVLQAQPNPQQEKNKSKNNNPLAPFFNFGP
jgi:serine protease Do